MPGENFPGDRIVSLVDELEALIEEAKPPFGKNAQFKVIEADVFYNILDEIRMSYPDEWQKSRRILKERRAARLGKRSGRLHHRRRAAAGAHHRWRAGDRAPRAAAGRRYPRSRPAV